jgi:probable selenium-dependent hydroxylase accessory protein YqeC
MQLHQMFHIRRGVTAVIGSGGKTSLLHALAAQLPGRVILCTTTKIYPSQQYPTLLNPTSAQILRFWHSGHDARVLCVGTPLVGGKLGPCALSMPHLCTLADYVLVEADGSQGKPLKAHASWEPVVPAHAAQTICVVGASGFGLPLSCAVHRPELWLPADTSPKSVAEMLRRENINAKIFVNQCESDAALADAHVLRRHLHRPVFAGSLKKGVVQCLH